VISIACAQARASGDSPRMAARTNSLGFWGYFVWSGPKSETPQPRPSPGTEATVPSMLWRISSNLLTFYL
jgi:hypothetical protein